MIDEKKLIEDIKLEIKCMNAEKEKYFQDGNFRNGNIIVEQVSAVKIIKKIINNQPKIGEWIPCSERLPEENQNVIACFIHGTVTELTFYNGEFHGVYDYDEKVITAWQPLPEAYKV